MPSTTPPDEPEPSSEPLPSPDVIDPPATTSGQGAAKRVGDALGRRSNWEQLVKFCIVGGAGYVVNLIVYTTLLRSAGLHYIPAAVGSFIVAVANNYALNRMWTFRIERGHIGAQGWRFLVVSTVSLLANLGVLHLLVTAGAGKIVGQAFAIVLVTPLNFLGNKLWSFRR
jgi:dolichol-phosphate mannosyltransferase